MSEDDRVSVILRADDKILVRCKPQQGAESMSHRDVSGFGLAGRDDICSARIVLSSYDVGVHDGWI